MNYEHGTRTKFIFLRIIQNKITVSEVNSWGRKEEKKELEEKRRGRGGG